MEKSNLKKISNQVFIPAILLSLLLSISSILFYLAQNTLVGKLLDVSQISALGVSTIIPQIILVLTLLIISKYKPFEKVFKGTLIAFIGIISLLTGLVFFQEHLQLNGTLGILEKFLPSHRAQMYEPIINNWPVSLLYIALNLLTFNLFSLLIWGFINRLTNLSEGIKYYIPLAFVIGLIGALVTNLGLLLVGASNWPLMALVIPAIAFMILSLILFNWAWKRLLDNFSHPKESLEASKIRFPFLTGAYLLAGAAMVEHFLAILFKSQIRMQFSDPSTYSNFIGNYATTVGSSTIIISILWMVLGTWLVIKKGWGTTALWGTISLLIGGLVFLSFYVANESASWLNQGIFTGLLKGTTTALFFPLIQIVYLCIPYQARFSTKILTEMIALPLMKGLPLPIVQGLMILLGTVYAVSMYLKIIILILLALLVIASRRISSKLQMDSKTI